MCEMNPFKTNKPTNPTTTTKELSSSPGEMSFETFNTQLKAQFNLWPYLFPSTVELEGGLYGGIGTSEMAALGGTLYLLWKAETWQDVIAIVAVASPLVQKLQLPQILLRIRTCDALQPQGAGSDRPWFSAAVALLFAYALAGAKGVMAFGSKPFWQVPAWRDITSVANLVSPLFNALFEFVYQQVTGLPLLTPELAAYETEIQNLTDRVTALDGVGLQDRLHDNVELCDTILALEESLHTLMQKATPAAFNRAAPASLTLVRAKILRWTNWVEAAGRGRGAPRTPPLVIRLWGDSGVGKSMLSQLLAAHITRGSLELAQGQCFSSLCYTRAVGSKHWNGYTGQPIVFYDDFGQLVDGETSPNPEFLELIQTANSSPLNLEMPDIERKARTFFTSSLMILTSNLDHYAVRSVTHEAAIWRRIHLDVQVRALRRPNGLLPPGVADTSIYSFNVGTYRAAYREGDRREFEELTWDQLVARCRIAYTERRAPDSNRRDQLETAFRPAPLAPQADFDTTVSLPLPESAFSYQSRELIEQDDYEEILRLLPHGARVEEIAKLRDAGTGEDSRLIFVRSPIALDLSLSAFDLLKPLAEDRSPLQRAYDAFCERWRGTTGWLGQLARRLQGLSLAAKIGTFAVMFGAAKLATLAFSKTILGTESPHERAPKSVIVHHRGLFSSKSTTTSLRTGGSSSPTANAEMAIDPVAHALSPKLRANVRSIYCGPTRVGFLTGLFGRVAMLPAHVYHGACESECSVQSANGPVSVDFKGLAGFESEADLVLLILPEDWQPFKDIRKHIVNEEDLVFTSFKARLVHPDAEYFTPATIVHHKDSYDDPITQREVTLTRSVHYTCLETAAGDCGALLTHCVKSLSRKILGFHVAGSSSYNVSRIVTRQEIDTIVDSLQLTAESAIPALDPRFEVVSQDVPYTFPKTSKLRPSPLSGIFPNTKGRAILRTIGDHDPLVSGVNRYAAAKTVPDSEWEPALDLAETLVCHPPEDSSLARVLTIAESLERWRELEPVRREKSSGHPWSRGNQGTKKSAWLDPVDPKLATALAEMEARALSGSPPTEVFVDCPKDEKRALARCDPSHPENIKTRVFSICPLDLVIQMRRYFGAFVSRTIEKRISNGLTAGIVPQSIEWDALANHLGSVGPATFDGDWAGFDTTLPASLIRAFGLLAERWYRLYDPNWTPEAAKVRAYLMLSVSESLHHVVGNIIRWSGGLPSGCFATNQIDSVANVIILIRAAQSAGVPSGDILSDIRLATHGDDNIFSVHPRLTDVFTPESVRAYGQTIGMKFTAADKGALGSYKTIDSCQFLKRGFRLYRGTYIAPLDLDSIREMVMWTAAPSNDSESFPQVLETAFEELVLHEQTPYVADTTMALYKGCREAGFAPMRPTLPETLLKYFSGLSLSRKQHNVGPVEASRDLRPNWKGKLIYETTQKEQPSRESQRLRVQPELKAQSNTAAPDSGIFAGAISGAMPDGRAAGVPPPTVHGSIGAVRRPDYPQHGFPRKPVGNRRTKRETGSASQQYAGGYFGGKPTQGWQNEAGFNVGLAAVPEVADVTGDTQIETVSYIDQVPQRKGGDPLTMRCSKDVLALEDAEHTIQDIIGRPRPREQFEWVQASVAGTNIWTLNLPFDLFSQPGAGNILPAITAKTNQFQYFRCTVNVRIALNAMQFHQGRLLLTFDPLMEMRGARASNTTFQYETGLKSIQIDPNKHQVVVLEIPMVAPYSHWGLPAGQFDMGTVRLTVLQPLATAVASQSVTITPTIYLTDVELSMPTPADNFLISSPSFLAASDLKAQSGEREAEEASAQKDGVISGPLAMVSSVAGGVASLTKGIFPRLSALSETTAWVTSFASGAARYFGYNKPSTYTGAKAYFDTGNYPNHLMDGGAQSVKLGASQDHDLPVAPGVFGTDADEMHISYIVSKPNILESFAWSQATPVGTSIGGSFVFPGVCPDFSTVAGGLGFQSTHTSFVASMFRYWTGSMQYRLALVSTGFHAGRLLITYVPNARTAPPTTLDEFGNSWSIIWDISERNDIEFTVPWCANVPALENILDDQNFSNLSLNRQGNDSGTMTTAAFLELASHFSNGRFEIVVLSQLVNPSSTRNVVDVQLFVNGGPDLEFIQPELSAYVPTVDGLADPPASSMLDFSVPTLTQSVATEIRAQKRDKLEAQGAFYQGDPAYPDKSILGTERESAEPLFAMQPVGTSQVATLIAGEKFTSLRQLIKRHSVVARFQEMVPESTLAMVDPNYFRIGSQQADSTFLRDFHMPVLDYVSSLYALYRGSQRFAFHVARGNGGQELTSLGLMVTRASGVATNRGPGSPAAFALNRQLIDSNSRTAMAIFSRSDRDVEFDVPYAARTACLPVRNRSSVIANAGSAAITDETAPLLIQLLGQSSAVSDVIVTRAASDDFSFGMMVGAPFLRKVQYTAHASTADGSVTIFR